MLTGRAWWLLFVSVLMLVIGLFGPQPVIALVALAILVWLSIQGLLFNLQAKWALRSLKLRRQLRDERGVVTSLWAGHAFEVRLTLRLDSHIGLSHVAFEELTPFGLDVVEGEPHGEGAIRLDEPLHVRYKVKATRAGAARFEGVRVQLADLHGLFYHVAFVQLQTSYRILPPFVDAEGKTATAKRYNMLPPPGIHRLPRPGTGSELLDLRDYLPGDPPKTIAWKVSARRDRLITKEYESEVPVRCTLFVDTSQSVRLGPPGRNALTRLVELAAGVAQANLGSRDMTGLCLFDEHETRILKPARSRRHLVQILNELADVAGQPAAAGHAPIEPLLPLAYAFAQEVYPEQLAKGVNHVPGWLPFLVRVPVHWVTPSGIVRRLFRGLYLLVVSLIYVFFFVSLYVDLEEFYWNQIPEGWREEILPPFGYVGIGYVILISLLFPFWILLWRDALPLVFSPRRRRLMRMRKKMAALFAVRYNLGAGGVELLLQDDTHFSAHLERFLNEHNIPHTPQMFDRRGRYLFRSPAKLERLTSALLRAVGKGHDNELFVLLVDLVELERDLDPLLRAVKVALARHHQVMLIVPWPPELDPPKREESRRHGTPEPASPRIKPGGSLGKKRRPVYSHMTLSELKEYLNRLMARRYHRAFQRLRKAFVRLQVPVLCAAEDDPIPLILDRIDRLRGVRRRR